MRSHRAAALDVFVVNAQRLRFEPLPDRSLPDVFAAIERLGALDTPVPFNVELMNAMLPSVDSIREKMEWLLRY